MSEKSRVYDDFFNDRRGLCLSRDPAFVLGVLYTLGFLGIVFRLLMFAVPEGNKQIIDQILPILSAIQLGIVQYFYTKTVQAQAERKDETIKKLAEAASTTATTAAVATGVSVAAVANGAHAAEAAKEGQHLKGASHE